MAHSTRAEKSAKVKKPSKDFPLFPHASGRWAKKVRGKFCYFGSTTGDPKGQAALLLWIDQKDDLLAGRTPRANRDGLTLHELCNQFCAAKERQVEAGELTKVSFTDYHRVCKLLLDKFGKRRFVDDLAAEDFELLRASMAKRLSPGTLGNEIQRIRVVFNYGYQSGLLDKPIRFGPGFKKPAKRILRAAKHKSGPKMFEARQIRRLLKAASLQMRAMIFLGINCGFGNRDCGTLEFSHVDLHGGWVDFPRPKTAIERRCPLWPETIEAIEQSVEKRTEPKNPEHSDLVFVTTFGEPWAKDTPDSPISKEMAKLLKKLSLQQKGRGFYALRHTFETIGGESRDQVAVNHIMGHADQSMSAHYRERISDERLQAVAATVREWLFRKGGAR